MFDQIIEKLKQDNPNWIQIHSFISERQIPVKTTLLKEGEISTHVHYIKKGCLREWFNKDGKEITFQFFFEGQFVASIDSFLNNQPSLYTIESIEPSLIYTINKKCFEQIYQSNPQFKEEFQKLIFNRFRNYANLFLSRIKDSPRERYEDLILNHPEIIKRIPQHYIASYLGITPISLSRIRNKK
ncbi:MAG TPA: Crp/Fnr family transcriptional regulator [Bacteroidales bacterium]|nr:Crp/Fnr family transcriptional regulator [Bacteroidales bacterium]